jgi:hypothetical protein
MNGPPRLAVLTEGGLKKLANVPRSAVLLVCLCLLGLGGFTVVQRFLFAFGDETALRVIRVFIGGPESYQVWRGDGNGHFSADEGSAYR